MRSVAAFNSGWHSHDGFEDQLKEELRPGLAVVLPHSAVELPLAYFDEIIYRCPFTY
jgi:beta-galactosidase